MRTRFSYLRAFLTIFAIALFGVLFTFGIISASHRSVSWTFFPNALVLWLAVAMVIYVVGVIISRGIELMRGSHREVRGFDVLPRDPASKDH